MGMAHTGEATASRESRIPPVETHPPRGGLSKKGLTFSSLKASE